MPLFEKLLLKKTKWAEQHIVTCALFWKCSLYQQKSMIAVRRWNYTVLRKLMNIGWWTGEKTDRNICS